MNSVTSIVTYPLANALIFRTTLSWGKSHFRRLAPHGFGQTQRNHFDRYDHDSGSHQERRGSRHTGC